MAKQISIGPDYKKIYNDIIARKFPSKGQECKDILGKEMMTNYDVIILNEKLFSKSNKDYLSTNQKFKSYSKDTILKVLDFQKKMKCTNTELSNQFNISRNTIAKWKKVFI